MCFTSCLYFSDIPVDCFCHLTFFSTISSAWQISRVDLPGKRIIIASAPLIVPYCTTHTPMSIASVTLVPIISATASVPLMPATALAPHISPIFATAAGPAVPYQPLPWLPLIPLVSAMSFVPLTPLNSVKEFFTTQTTHSVRRSGPPTQRCCSSTHRDDMPLIHHEVVRGGARSKLLCC